jgi:NADPH:quinone reductase-like Zn-dependent oxidoreductase
MKAAVQTRYGQPEVVLISKVDKPATGDNEVLVRVHATTVNRTTAPAGLPGPSS